jgi:arylsulfatase A-like enzyme
MGLGLAAIAAPLRAQPPGDSEAAQLRAAEDRPNFIVILTDDQGYGDLGCFGSTAIETPRIDQMASEGMKLTSFYTQPVCGPARAALMTGSYPTRAMMRGRWQLHTTEITVAEILRDAGYATGCVGKWDLSGRKFARSMLPTDQGFDYYFGTLGSNDAGWVVFYENTLKAGVTDDMGRLTKLYTDRAIKFIEEHKSHPFFLYLAHSMPHVKIDASRRFRGRSKGGLYGDVIEEIDWNVGRILDAVEKSGLDERTIIFFMSDNGPWLSKGTGGGSAAALRDGKGSAWEGGFRVPCIVRGPGRIPAGRVSNAMMATLDILPTLAALAGAKLPDDRVIDGRDQSPLITGKSDESARETFYYYVKDNLHAVRSGKWKLALPNRKAFYNYARDAAAVEEPQLYDLDSNLAEKNDVAARHPDVVEELLELAERAREDIGDMKEIGKNARPFPPPRDGALLEKGEEDETEP